MENENKLRGFIKTTLREFLNEQKQNGNDKPPWMGTQYNQINKLYELTDDDFSYVPSSVKYLGINIDRTLLGNILDHYNENDEEKYQRAIKNLDFFFIYYNGKRYVYSKHLRTLRDKHDRKINASEQDEVFNQQMNQIIHNTLKENEVIFLTWREFKSNSSLCDGFVTKANFKFKNKSDKEICDVSDINQFGIEGGSYFCTTYNCIEHYRENPGYFDEDDFIINDDAIIAISENQFIMDDEKMKEEIMSKADGFYCSPYDTYGLVIWNKEKIKKK